MQIIKSAQRVEQWSYSRAFDYVGTPGSGFGFPCTEEGNILASQMNDASWENYKKCVRGEYSVVDKGIRREFHCYTEPAEGKCDCGSIVHLANFTNTCDCGRDYNMSGQALAPRSQWGEETGEYWSECY
jgi:hypothetical protein